MMKFFLFSFFLFFINLSYTQQFTFEIDWKSPSRVEFGEKDYLLPNFENVSYDNGKPMFFEKVIVKTSDLQVDGVSFEVIKCSAEEIQYLNVLEFKISVDLQFSLSQDFHLFLRMV